MAHQKAVDHLWVNFVKWLPPFAQRCWRTCKCSGTSAQRNTLRRAMENSWPRRAQWRMNKVTRSHKNSALNPTSVSFCIHCSREQDQTGKVPYQSTKIELLSWWHVGLPAPVYLLCVDGQRRLRWRQTCGCMAQTRLPFEVETLHCKRPSECPALQRYTLFKFTVPANTRTHTTSHFFKLVFVHVYLCIYINML